MSYKIDFDVLNEKEERKEREKEIKIISDWLNVSFNVVKKNKKKIFEFAAKILQEKQLR